MAYRVLIAGLFHETHTFLEGLTPLADWEIRRGNELLEAEGDGSPLGGVLKVAREEGWQVLPTIDMRTAPSALATDDVVETFWEALARGVETARPQGLDGIYLVLHGAMASQSYPDVEGEILERLAKLVADPKIPVCGVLDLHCNYTARMARYSHALVAYRENPHIDAEAAAIDAARILGRLMRSGEQATTVWAQPPVMWPPTGVGTADDPMRSLEAMARAMEREYPELLAVNVFAGFAFADTPDSGVAFSASTVGNPDEAQRCVDRLRDWAIEHRELGNVVDPDIESVIDEALAKAAQAGPVLLVEPSDNIGGGAPGDGTGVLKSLLAHGAQNAVVVINDPQAVQQLQHVAIGQKQRLSIGARGSAMNSGPVEGEFELISRSDGRFELEDRNSHLASMCGIHIDMGPSAVVRIDGVRVLLTSRKTPPFDLGQLRSQGIVPEEAAIIGVKAAVAHRRAYDPIAKASYTIDTPGPCSSNLKSFPYKKIRRPIFPLDDVTP